jgi:hypothetical protein
MGYSLLAVLHSLYSGYVAKSINQCVKEDENNASQMYVFAGAN